MSPKELRFALMKFSQYYRYQTTLKTDRKIMDLAIIKI